MNTALNTASIREVQHGLAKLLLLIQAGESITITKRNKPIAEIRPLTQKKKARIQRPDFYKQLQEISGGRVLAVSNGEFLSEMREDRF